MSSIRSILQDIREDMGSISRRGFSKSRSHRVSSSVSASVFVEASAVAVGQSCWANMPPELLREVLVRIEDAEARWPDRRHVVACAGVCRSWREIMKDIVATPELSGKLTFPFSLKLPGPRDFLMQCFIKRNRTTQTYYLYLGLTQALTDDGKLLLMARKCRRATCTDYVISLDANDVSKGSNAYIGKLRSNFLGTKFTVYDAHPPHSGAMAARSRSTRYLGSKVAPRVPAGNYPVAHIGYELNMLGSRGPRRMQCAMDAIPASAIEPGGVVPTRTEFLINGLDSFASMPSFRSKLSRSDIFLSGPLSALKEGMLVLKNKAPRWHEQLQCWCLNFRGA